MKTVTCPYNKISEKEALQNSYDLSTFSFVQTANAQSSNNTNFVQQGLDELSVPFYILIFSFFLFIILMSAVYIYHWLKFSLNDPFVKNFVSIFFFGLVALTIPLIFNLIN